MNINILKLIILIIKHCPGFSNLTMAIIGTILYSKSYFFCDISQPLLLTLSNFTLGWFISGYIVFLSIFIDYILINYFKNKLPKWYNLFKKIYGSIILLFQFIWFSLSIIGLTEIYNICKINQIPSLSSYILSYILIFSIIFYSILVCFLHKPELISLGINLFD